MDIRSLVSLYYELLPKFLLSFSKNSLNSIFCASCRKDLLLKERYRALHVLGIGGFGRTFKNIDEDKPGKPFCVVKQINSSNLPTSHEKFMLDLFYQEARCLEQLGQHNQIPDLLAYFDIQGQPYLVQQFVDGQDLGQEIHLLGTFSYEKIRETLNFLLPLLDFIHNQSPPIIHRDIKPNNIIRRNSDGSLVLIDFGIAKQVLHVCSSQPNPIIGTPGFMPPEQSIGQEVTFSGDIYSLGMTCIFLLTHENL